MQVGNPVRRDEGGRAQAASLRTAGPKVSAHLATA